VLGHGFTAPWLFVAVVPAVVMELLGSFIRTAPGVRGLGLLLLPLSALAYVILITS
jgi:hypothetical protein